MLKRKFGGTGYEIAPVVFGGIINTNETQADAGRYVAYAVERGVNYFDVAPSYGDAEERLGPALKPYRKNVYLACKTTRRDAKGSKEELLASLKRLQTDYFDVYQLHSIREAADVDEAFSAGGVMETIKWALGEGIVRKAGITAHSEDQALRCLNLYSFDTVLFPMNWALGVNRGFGDKISEAVKAKGIGLLCMKTLAHRVWANDAEKAGAKSWYKPVELSDRSSVELSDRSPGELSDRSSVSPATSETSATSAASASLPLAAMKYGLSKGAAALVPPGNFAAFKFMLEHIDEAIANPLSQNELDLLKIEASKIIGREIF